VLESSIERHGRTPDEAAARAAGLRHHRGQFAQQPLRMAADAVGAQERDVERPPVDDRSQRCTASRRTASTRSA
jgi:hypothetical protein